MDFGKFLNVFCILILIYMWVIAGISYSSLPDEIPTHFGVDGRPDSMGPRLMVFLLPAASVLIYAVMRYISTTSVKKFESDLQEKVRKNKGLTRNFVRIITVFVFLLVADILTESILVAQLQSEKLSMVSSIIIFAMFAAIILYFIYARKKVHRID